MKPSYARYIDTRMDLPPPTSRMAAILSAPRKLQLTQKSANRAWNYADKEIIDIFSRPREIQFTPAEITRLLKCREVGKKMIRWMSECLAAHGAEPLPAPKEVKTCPTCGTKRRY